MITFHLSAEVNVFVQVYIVRVLVISPNFKQCVIRAVIF